MPRNVFHAIFALGNSVPEDTRRSSYFHDETLAGGLVLTGKAEQGAVVWSKCRGGSCSKGAASVGILLFGFLASCGGPPRHTSEAPTDPPAGEQTIHEIKLSGTISNRDTEISGLVWHGEDLILLPQRPERLSSADNGLVFSLAKTDLLRYLEANSPAPLIPREIVLEMDFEAPAGFQGFEAIAVRGDTAYVTGEVKGEFGMTAFVLIGVFTEEGDTLRLGSKVTPIIVPIDRDNMGYEALVASSVGLIALYEVNGHTFNPDAHIKKLNWGLDTQEDLPMVNLEYRVTDATGVDEEDRFWVLNYFWPGDEWMRPSTDPLLRKHKTGRTHSVLPQVERLVELQRRGDGVYFTTRTPIQLQLVEDARNWEGVVRLGESGFLIVTDYFPRTVFAFVANGYSGTAGGR